MRHTSVPLNEPIEIIDIVPVNPLISKCQIKVCYVSDDPNRNRTIITKETAKYIAKSLPGSPIVGKFNQEKQDFEEHNRFVTFEDGKLVLTTDTQPYGFVDLHAKVWFQKFLDDNSIEREYLVTEGWLWTGQYPEAQRIMTDGNGQSMELDEDPKNLNGHWTKDGNGKPQFFIINEAIVTKLCLLGDDIEPCFEGSSITAFSLGDDFKNKVYSMMEEIKELLSKGGADMQDNEIIAQDEATPMIEEVTPVIEETPEPIVEADPIVTEEPESLDNPEQTITPVIEEPMAVVYNLEEIPEYVELQGQYSSLLEQHTELQSQLAELQSVREALEASNAALTAFKAAIEKKEKEAMIARFYMLSEEDKRDVINNIDSYSLDEIESKLSIICVRNKVSFTQDEETIPTATFSLDSFHNDSEATMPAWVKAALEVAKTMN